MSGHLPPAGPEHSAPPPPPPPGTVLLPPQQPLPPPYGYLQPPLPPKETSTLPALALIFSLLPILIISQVIGLTLAVVHLTRSTKRDSARGMAIAAAVLSVVMGVVYLVAMNVLLQMRASSTNESSAPRNSISAADLSVGDCGMYPEDDGDVYDVTVVPCSEPHTFEMYAVFDLGSEAPANEKRIDQLAEAGCDARFADYVGIPYEDSTLETAYFSPTLDYWDEDSSVQCMVVTDEPRSGSVEGSND